MPEQKSFLKSRVTLALALPAAVLTFLVYLPALYNGFVNWDDPGYIFESPLSPMNHVFFKWAFTSVVISNWHPLTMISLAIDYSIWGPNPFGYHLVNNIFHSLNTLLAGVLALRLLEARALATGGEFKAGKGAAFTVLLTALLFGLHPAHVQSVAWISERKDVLCAFFYILSILFYIRYACLKKAPYYLGSMAVFVLALLSKPMAVSLPAVLLIIDLYPLERFWTAKKSGGFLKALIEKAPFAALAAVFSGIAILAQKKALAPGSFIPFAQRAMIAMRGFIFYIYKIVFPLSLAPYYPYPLKFALTFEYLAALAVFALITLFCVFTFKKNRIFSAVWLFYVITLLPVIGLVQVGTQSAADRYTYIPSIGPFLLPGVGAGYLLKNALNRAFIAVALASVMLIVTMAFMTINQISVWKDSVALWSYELDYLERTPDSADMIKIDNREFQYVSRKIYPYYNRALAYMRIKEYQKAVEDLDRVIELNPGYSMAYVKRGVAYGEAGDYARALKEFDTAINIDPGNREAVYNRDVAKRMLGK